MPKKPIRLVHTTYEVGFGGGISRMDVLYHRFLDRNIVDPVFVVPLPEPDDKNFYDPSIQYIFTGADNRFEKLVKTMADADIVQFSGGFDPLTCEAARTAGVPAIVEIMHHTEPGQLFDYIDVSVCVSETVKRVQPNQDKAVVIHNGIDTAGFPFEREKKPAGKIVFLESTRREKKMWLHLDELADDILKLAPNAELWLAGRGQTGESTDNVKFLGLRTDIDSLYRQADFMILLSKKEPFGLVALEAMASGCVPIVANDGGLAEIITHGVDGFTVDAKDKNAIIKVIDEALKIHSSNKWQNIMNAARKTADEKFTPRRCVEQYEKLYLNLIEQTSRKKTGTTKNIKPTADSLCADAVYYFESGWEKVKETAQKMLETDTVFSSPGTASPMAIIAKGAITAGRNEVADMIFRKLYRDGFNNPEWRKKWFSIANDDDEVNNAINEYLSQYPYDPEVIMFATERALNRGDTKEAMKILTTGVSANPSAGDLKNLYDLLKGKVENR